MGAELERLPPNEVKQWVLDMGLDPTDFKHGVPSAELPSELQPSPGSLPMISSPQLPVGGPGRGAHAEHVTAAVAAAMPSSPRSPANGPSWTREEWCTPELYAQIEAVTVAQGVHRDERSLLAGSLVTSQQAQGGTNETSRVALDNGMVGYHKPFDGLDDDLAVYYGQNSPQQLVHEAVAWQLASQLGPPWSEMVPPCVIREAGGRLGSFALERAGRPGVEDPANVPEWREAAFYDALIGQQDRHSNNYLVAGDRLALIDHGYAFARDGDYCNYSALVEKRHANDPVLSHIERQVLDRLLASKDLLGVESMLEPDRAAALRSRAEGMRTTGRVLQPGEF